MIGPALPETEVKYRIRWSCGLARCLHKTRAGATFHGMVMKQGLAQIVLQQPKEPDQAELMVKHKRDREVREPDELRSTVSTSTGVA